MIVALIDQVRYFREEVLHHCLDFIENEVQTTEAWFVYERVLKTIGLVYSCIATHRAPDDLAEIARLAAVEMLRLRTAAVETIAGSPVNRMVAVEFAVTRVGFEPTRPYRCKPEPVSVVYVAWVGFEPYLGTLC